MSPNARAVLGELTRLVAPDGTCSYSAIDRMEIDRHVVESGFAELVGRGLVRRQGSALTVTVRDADVTPRDRTSAPALEVDD